jgi:hypothetical protein
MKHDPASTLIYHITDMANLPAIIDGGGLLSDAKMADSTPSVVIGYDHIKLRRLKEIRVHCCGNRFVGEFVPFYFCPRSPMLFVVNKGNTGRPAGCQSSILHLVSTVQTGISLGRDWAISGGNAGASYASFSADITELDALDWESINARQWSGRTHQKSAEFLLRDSFPWSGIQGIGCQNSSVASEVVSMLKQGVHQPQVVVRPAWYY